MENNEKYIDFNDLTAKYLANEASEEEISLLEEWVLKNDENKKIFNDLKQAWILSNLNKSNKNIDINEEWDKIQLKLFKDKAKYISINKHSNQRKLIPLVYKIAAAILIPLVSLLFLYYLVYKPGTDNLIAQDSIITNTLPDGTIVTLNYNSKLTFPEKFNRKIRKVKLEGDAFFNVEHNDEQPFIIETQDINIKVLGTSFFVNSRKQNSTIEVVVNTGKVALKAGDNKIILKANERGIYNKSSGILHKEKNNDVNYNSWKTKYLIFENAVLYDVIRKINEAYHIHIKIINPEMNNCRITVTFNNQSIDAVLNILQETLDLKIEKHNNYISISGKGCD